MSPSTSTSSYALALADGQTWRFVATMEVSAWVGEFAAVMGLSPASDAAGAEYVFVRADGLEGGLPPPAAGWREASPGLIRLWRDRGRDRVLGGLPVLTDPKLKAFAMWLALLPVYERALTRGGAPFHAGLIERDGKGYLLAAPGGGGKSTTCRRVTPPWRAWCDDETLVARTAGGGYAAHPFPTWSDVIMGRARPNWETGRAIDLHGAFFLEPGDRDRAERVGAGQAAVMLFNSVAPMFRTWLKKPPGDDQAGLATLFSSVARLAESKPAWVLRATRQGDFLAEIERALEHGD